VGEYFFWYQPIWVVSDEGQLNGCVCVCVNGSVVESSQRYGDSADNTVEENSSVFSLIQMCWLPSAKACNFAPAKSFSF